MFIAINKSIVSELNINYGFIGEIMAVGSYKGHKHSEVYIEPFNSWHQVQDYPHATGFEHCKP